MNLLSQRNSNKKRAQKKKKNGVHLPNVQNFVFCLTRTELIKITFVKKIQNIIKIN